MNAILSGSIYNDALREIQSWFSKVDDILITRLINKPFSSLRWSIYSLEQILKRIYYVAKEQNEYTLSLTNNKKTPRIISLITYRDLVSLGFSIDPPIVDEQKLLSISNIIITWS